ncbi:MAG: hypothetical protein ACRCWI_03730 [Brevinema sp.]
MHSILISLFSFYLLIPIFLYNTKDVHRVHVMKFTGSFDIIYQDTKLLSDDLTITQPFIILDSTPILAESYIQRTAVEQISYLQQFFISYLPRAPPFFLS